MMAISALNSGISAMKAFESALDSSAHNVANASTNNFQPQTTRFQEGVNGGVVVNISQASKTLSAQSNGSSSTLPSETDLGTEITNSLQYKIGFQMAAKLVKTSDEVLDTLVNMKK
jgi:flagellar basal-body rod protein FlgC